MTAQEIKDAYVALCRELHQPASMIELVQKKGVSPEDIAKHFCPGNAVDGFFELMRQTSNQW